MASRSSMALNGSARSLADVRRLTEASPAEARGYLEAVKDALPALAGAAGAEAAGAIDAVLARDDAALLAGLDGLTALFPADADGWGAIQAARAAGIGWSASEGTPPLQYIRGTVARSADLERATLTTAGGAVYDLRMSERASTYYPEGPSGMLGLIGDGEVSLQGTLGNDGVTFKVEGYALDVDGKFDTFVFGRVNESSVGRLDTVQIETARGPVYVTHPELSAKLKAMPRLATILPGSPVLRDGKWFYDANPEELFGLARFMTHELQAGFGGQFVRADMAYSSFTYQPMTLPPGVADRIGHEERIWARGDIVLGATGTAERFAASYVSRRTDGLRVPLNKVSPYDRNPRHLPVGDADPLRVAVALTEAGASQAGVVASDS